MPPLTFGNEPVWAFHCKSVRYGHTISALNPGCGNRSLLERASNLYERPSALHARLLRAHASGRRPYANGALTSLAGNIDDRGCTLRSLLGPEDDRKAFKRYKAIRHRAREYV